jgi:hypothetical protein
MVPVATKATVETGATKAIVATHETVVLERSWRLVRPGRDRRVCLVTLRLGLVRLG